MECEPAEKGPDTLRFHLFTNRGDQEAFLKGTLEQMTREGVGCSQDFPYLSAWVDSAGVKRGDVQCADYSDRATLLWSDDESLVVGSAKSLPKRETELHEWWQRYVRFSGDEPPAGRQRFLVSLLPPSFGECHAEALLLPAAVTGVLCQAGDGISSAGASLFPSRALLSNYIERQADRRGIDAEGCDVSPFSYMPYGPAPTYKPTLGHLVCRPEDGAEWFEWSAERPLVYAFASRNDNDFLALYRQWSQSLSLIRHLREAPGQA